MTEICSVYLTTSNREEAVSIGRKMVELKLAACANIMDNLTSIYYWENTLQEETESAVLLKTKRSLFNELENMIKELHSYENPCIVAFPVLDASNEYVEWVIKNCKD